MSRLIFSIGIPGAGKTSLLKRLADKHSAEYMSPDDIRIELFGKVDDHSDDIKVWAIARARIAESLGEGKVVVFDSTFSKHDRRVAFIEDCGKSGATRIEGIYFELPLEEILRRNSSREKVVAEEHLRMSYELLQKDPPKIQDGFDDLVSIDENGTYTDCTANKGSQLIVELRALQ